MRNERDTAVTKHDSDINTDTYKHPLFDTDVATTPTRSNQSRFCSATIHLTVHPQQNIIKNMSSGNHRE